MWSADSSSMGNGRIPWASRCSGTKRSGVAASESRPAECFAAISQAEAALRLHPQVAQRLAAITRIVIETQESGKRIIDKRGPLDNPADRDHCLQYMVAVPLIFGRLTASDYEDDVASDPRIDGLREKMEVAENKQFTVDYLDPAKRSIGMVNRGERPWNCASISK